jgi:hypothetical protein
LEIAAISFNLILKIPRKRPLHCFVHIKDSELLTLFREDELFTISPNFSLTLFNIYEKAARLLFHKYPLDKIAETVNKDTSPIHLVVMGFNEMGQNIILQAVRLSSYANEEKVHITIIDKDVEEKKKAFLRIFRLISEVCTLNFESIEINESEQIWKVLKKDERPPISMIIICPENDSAGLIYARSLLPYLSGHRTSRGLKIPIFIHMRFDAGLAVILQTDRQFIKDNFIQPFGMINQSCTRELVVDDSLSNLARTFHNYYNMEKQEKDRIKWEKLSETLKDSNLQQADHIPIKVRAVGCDIRKLEAQKRVSFNFTEEEIELLSRMEHNRWIIERKLKGYTHAYIEKTNHKTKQSPNLVSYDELSEENKDYNRKAIKIIPEVLNYLEIEIYRPIGS